MERLRKDHLVKESDKILILMKSLLVSYVLTGAFLVLLAVMLYKFSLSEKIVSICIIGIYIIASFLAGFLTGKKIGSKKFLWGILMGIVYFIILALISVIANHSFKDVGTNFFTIFILCAASGMLGGMLS